MQGRYHWSELKLSLVTIEIAIETEAGTFGKEEKALLGTSVRGWAQGGGLRFKAAGELRARGEHALVNRVEAVVVEQATERERLRDLQGLLIQEAEAWDYE